MPLRLLLALTFVVSCAVGLGYLLSADNTVRFSWITGESEGRSPPPSGTDTAHSKPEPTETPTTEKQPPSDNAIGFMLASAASQYSQNIRYPTYSIPISEDQARAYAGNRFDPVELPLDGGGQFTVTLEKYRFVQEEDILVAASITGSQVVGPSLDAALESSTSRQAIANATLKNEAGAPYYEGVIEASADPGEYRLVVEATIDGNPVRHVSTLTIEPDLGEFDGLGDPRVTNNDLIIPVHFDAKDPGFYALSAQLAGHNVILVHGFQQEDLANPPADLNEVKNAGEDYWRTFWLSRSDARVDWGSDGRVEGNIAQQAYQQLRDISQQGLCNDFCIVVSHSTGDLVTRYLLENQARWLQADGLQPLKILAAIDYSGAGGGTELADLALNVAYNDSWYNWPLKQAVRAFTGITPEPGSLGVVNDLQTNAARNLAVSPNNIPRLRFVAGGSSYGGITKPFIAGTDDGVVPTHSACGATTSNGIDSCSSNLSLAGKVSSQNGPSDLYYNHFPILMNEGASHSGVLGSETGNISVPVVNDTTLNGLRVDFASRTYNKRAWWQWWGSGDRYVEVPGSDQTDMSTLVYNTLNN